MLSGKPKISVICPAFREEECLPAFHRELTAVLGRLEDRFEFEVIYIDDGSGDGTLQVMKDLARQDARARYLSLSRNFGKEAALTAGLEHAQGDAVIPMDTDLQHPPALIPQLLDKWSEGFDVVLTVREEDKRLGLGKRLTSKLFYRIMSSLSETDIRPARCDYRLMTRKVVQALLRCREQHRFMRGMVEWLGFTTAEIVFQPDSRKAGQTKFNFRSLFNLAVDGILSFSTVPLRIPFYLGAICVALGLALTVLGVGQSLWTGKWEWSTAGTLLVAVHLLAGAILCVLGVLGEYVGRIYEQVKERPIYVLKDHSPEFAAQPASSMDRRDAA